MPMRHLPSGSISLPLMTRSTYFGSVHVNSIICPELSLMIQSSKLSWIKCLLFVVSGVPLRLVEGTTSDLVRTATLSLPCEFGIL
ncbi:hypothetical protein ARMGADRAFT_466796 [Armillaria gallica]|uniref:Uncharacterized protein n=1 Tax=Armillaria gallica TaxID=47427 RepID=A0A2H3CVN4_ARMGA|nr:hypothetical protein ARMGADRAFT_466796 [Armillaria gallica]